MENNDGDILFPFQSRHNNRDGTDQGGYALITDFTVALDRLQLKGAAANYYLGTSGVTGVTGTGLFLEQGTTDELIAIVRSSNTTVLTASNTIATAVFV